MTRACVVGLAIGLANAHACQAVGQHVQLQGSVTHKTFAGPPGYVDISQGDARELVPVLRLKRSLCVTGVRGTNDLQQHWIREVQLLDTREQLHQPDAHACPRQCVVSGELARADSGHHHLTVLLDIDRIALQSGPH